MRGETKTGFKFNIRESIKEDFRFWRKVAKLSKEENAEKNPFLAFEVYEDLLGEKQLEKLEKHVEKKGVVSIKDIDEEVSNIFAEIGKTDKEAKNS